MIFTDVISTLERVQPMELTGTVSQVRGLTVRVDDLPLPVGAMVEVRTGQRRLVGEIVGFDHDQTIVMLLGFTAGIRRGDQVVGLQSAAMVPVGYELLGRVVNPLGEPIDGKGAVRETVARALMPDPLKPLARVPIDQPLGTGVRAIDAMLTVGRGQRLGIFAGPGVGKSTLLGQIVRGTDADVSVIALVGERGREVNDFLRHSLGEEGLARSVVVVATGDDPALLRTRAAFYALSVAEFFRDQGMAVVLFMDSVTRFCQAQRQIGLAAGEPPATKGYTPSVFAMLPTLMERCGRTAEGSITGFYTILVEGDDMTEPISDACRGILDGHVILSRELANRGHYPAIDVLDSVSRLSNEVTDKAHQASRREVLRLSSLYRQVEDLVNIGAYAHGANPENDLAIAMRPGILEMLAQTLDEKPTFGENRERLLGVAMEIGRTAEKLAKQAKGRVGQAAGRA
ncbi:MAG: FliI/YscN family ATPase [Phycisphaerales bacterium]